MRRSTCPLLIRQRYPWTRAADQHLRAARASACRQLRSLRSSMSAGKLSSSVLFQPRDVSFACSIPAGSLASGLHLFTTLTSGFPLLSIRRCTTFAGSAPAISLHDQRTKFSQKTSSLPDRANDMRVVWTEGSIRAERKRACLHLLWRGRGRIIVAAIQTSSAAAFDIARGPSRYIHNVLPAAHSSARGRWWCSNHS